MTKTSDDHHGSVATFSCDTGFSLNDAMPITCNAESADADWPAPNTTPQCAGKVVVVVLAASKHNVKRILALAWNTLTRILSTFFRSCTVGNLVSLTSP